MGRGRDWNVDLIPKFLMANGKELYHHLWHCLESGLEVENITPGLRPWVIC